MLRALLCSLLVLSWLPAGAAASPRACTMALLLALDVSNSVDGSEYSLQVVGLADALRDPEVISALVNGRVAVAVMQWSGATEQRVSIPWRTLVGSSDALLLSASVRGLSRAFERSGTAPAEALHRGLALMRDAPPCGRRVIDISGDGIRNQGGSAAAARDRAVAEGVLVNAIVIERQGHGVADFYLSELVTPGGFVMRARGHADYPRAIRAKLLRELADPVG